MDPTELQISAQPLLHRPTGACHTSHIIPPSRICATSGVAVSETYLSRGAVGGAVGVLVVRVGWLADEGGGGVGGEYDGASEFWCHDEGAIATGV